MQLCWSGVSLDLVRQTQKRALEISCKTLTESTCTLCRWQRLAGLVEDEFSRRGNDPLPNPLSVLKQGETEKLPTSSESSRESDIDKKRHPFPAELKEPHEAPPESAPPVPLPRSQPPHRALPYLLATHSAPSPPASAPPASVQSLKAPFGGVQLPLYEPCAPGCSSKTKPPVQPKPHQVKMHDRRVFPAAASGGVKNEVWFHGVLPRDEAQRLLTEDGDFLVRETENKSSGAQQLVLSAKHQQFMHIIMHQEQGQWRFGGPSFSTVHELLKHYLNEAIPVNVNTGVILKRHIPREAWELNNDDVEIFETIGQGNFGKVLRGRYKPTGEIVAVKMCKESMSDEDKKKFIAEGRILKQYQHPNVVQFIGIAAHTAPVMILLEYIAGGSLHSHLRTHREARDLSRESLRHMCLDAAKGMTYLASKNCIHRDLAARNCLITDESVVKISDFGMSKDEGEGVYDAKNLRSVPVKWTALEALNLGKFSIQSDVWSFGIMMWEVYSYATVPYSNMRNDEAKEQVERGKRLDKPEGCPSSVYSIMLSCWNTDPSKRPQFSEIVQKLQKNT